MKKCSSCLEVKSPSDFNRQSAAKDGLQSKCRACQKHHYTEYHEACVDNINTRKRQHYSENFEKLSTERKRWRRDNPEKAKEEDQKNYLNNGKGRAKKFAEANPGVKEAYNAQARAVYTGILVKPCSCVSCGNESGKIEAHHCDYNKPLDILWLCKKCHKEWHESNTPTYVEGDALYYKYLDK